MAGVGHRTLWLLVTVTFMFVLSAWVSCSMCLTLDEPGKTLQRTSVGEAKEAREGRGKILFNGKDLELQVDSSFVAAPGKLLKIIFGQSPLSKTLEQEDSKNKEAEWKHLQPSLHCGQNQLEFSATGHKAADIQLDIGAVDPLPLIQVPETCGYKMRKRALGFVLAVAYDGCNMIRENGNYVLKMKWLNASVHFICSMTSSSKLLDPYASQSTQEPELFPVIPWRPNRHRRAATEQLYYDPESLYHYYYTCLYNYYMYLWYLVHASKTTTASPPRHDGQIPLYYPYYNPYYYQVGNTPVKTPQSSHLDYTPSTHPKSQYHHDPPKKLPFYPPSGPNQHGFPGSPLHQQVHQQHHGKYQYPIPHHHTTAPSPTRPNDHTRPNPSSTSTPATVTATPCPNQERPIGGTCLGAVSTYVPYKNLTFRPYISYEAGAPPKDQHPIHPRAFPDFESYEQALMQSLLLANPVGENPWDYYYYYLPYVGEVGN